MCIYLYRYIELLWSYLRVCSGSRLREGGHILPLMSMSRLNFYPQPDQVKYPTAGRSVLLRSLGGGVFSVMFGYKQVQ